jgi:tetratricopeptide (TPR) repeat protein
VLYRAERWDEVRQLCEEVNERFPEPPICLGHLGRLAARRGDREEAQRIIEELLSFAHPYWDGAITLERARISALLGDRYQATTLLRHALNQGWGVGYEEWPHRDMDFESLRDYPPFQELLQPKG